MNTSKLLVFWFSSILVSYCAVLLSYIFLIATPVIHEFLHSVGFALYGIPTIILLEVPVMNGVGTLSMCIPLHFLVYDDSTSKLLMFYSTSLAVNFPYLTCNTVNFSTSILFFILALRSEGLWRVWLLSVATSIFLASVAVWLVVISQDLVFEWVTDILLTFNIPFV